MIGLTTVLQQTIEKVDILTSEQKYISNRVSVDTKKVSGTTTVFATFASNYLKPWIKTGRRGFAKISTGSIWSINDTYYLVTCLHGVQYSTDVRCLVSVEKGEGKGNEKKETNDDQLQLSLGERIDIPEFDLTLIRLMDPIPEQVKPYCLTMDSLKTTIDQSSLTLLNTSKFKLHKFRYQMQPQYNCLPSMPIILTEIETTSGEELPGLSGSMGIDPDKSVYGMVVSVIDKTHDVIICPASVLQPIFEQVATTGTYSGLMIMPLVTEYVEGELETGESVNMYMVHSAHQSLKPGYLISHVGSIPVGQDGFKFHNWTVPLTTYLSLTYQTTDPISLTYYTEDSDHPKKTKLVMYNYRDSVKLSSTSEFKYVTIDGYTFVELTDSLLQEWCGINVNYYNSLKRDCVSQPYSLTRKRKLVGVVCSPSKIINRFIHNQQMPLVKKVNGKMVYGLDDLKHNYPMELVLGLSGKAAAYAVKLVPTHAESVRPA